MTRSHVPKFLTKGSLMIFAKLSFMALIALTFGTVSTEAHTAGVSAAHAYCMDIPNTNTPSRPYSRAACFDVANSGGYFDANAIQVCARMTRYSYYANCLSAIRNKRYHPHDLSTCAAAYTSGEVLHCLRVAAQ